MACEQLIKIMSAAVSVPSCKRRSEAALAATRAVAPSSRSSPAGGRRPIVLELKILPGCCHRLEAPGLARWH